MQTGACMHKDGGLIVCHMRERSINCVAIIHQTDWCRARCSWTPVVFPSISRHWYLPLVQYCDMKCNDMPCHVVVHAHLGVRWQQDEPAFACAYVV